MLPSVLTYSTCSALPGAGVGSVKPGERILVETIGKGEINCTCPWVTGAAVNTSSKSRGVALNYVVALCSCGAVLPAVVGRLNGKHTYKYICTCSRMWEQV